MERGTVYPPLSPTTQESIRGDPRDASEMEMNGRNKMDDGKACILITTLHYNYNYNYMNTHVDEAP